ncbi:MAG TPA: hypothetical protein PLA68_06550 [Panacibacter sp.]|nr:hypothetical protein [Panacibacter sp.]
MTKFIKHISLVIAVLQILACDTRQKVETPDLNKEKNIFGLYSYFVTGNYYHCESVKHSLQLNEDSTFVLKIYCYADSTSLFTPIIKTGKWVKENNSMFDFFCSNNTSFKVELLNDSTIKIIVKKGEEKFNYPFKRDTTKDEMFWQRVQLKK